MDTTLIMMVGTPGSGKSTFANKISDRYMIPVVSSDAVREKLYGNEAIQGDYNEVFDEVYRQVNDFLGCGVCILDATNCTRFSRTKAMARTAPQNVIYIVMDSDIKKALKQNEERERTVPKQVIRKMATNLRKEPPDVREGRNVRIFKYNDPNLIDLLEAL